MWHALGVLSTAFLNAITIEHKPNFP
ncbi:hypothetical protein XFF7767_850024 [Xanthomonas citri pv. fuscans]|nr:hypothetical protein XFF7767_850024 [Xanthomonas citri pv. fuscans]